MIEYIEDYKLDKVLLIYKHSKDKTYIEEGSIRKGALCEYKPLSIETANDLGRALYKSNTKFIGGPIPSNLYYTHIINEKSLLVWVTPASVKTLLFNGIDLEDGLYPVPKMLWKYYNGDLNVRVINKNDEICYAPFGNISDEGKVCMGSANKFIRDNRFKTFNQCMVVCETAFFQSKFTHFADTNSRIVKGNVLSIFKKLKNKETFMNSCLIPTGESLNQYYGKF